MNNKYSFLLFLTVFSCSDPSINLNVPDLRDKSPIEVKQALGEPDTIYNRSILGKKLFVMRYFEHRDAEFRFLRASNQLESITIHKPFDLDFKPEIIEEFGLKFVPPNDVDTASYFRWKNLEGLSNVNIYKVGLKRPEGVKTYFNIYFDLH